MKASKTDNTNTLTKEDICTIAEVIVAIARDSLFVLKTQQVSIANQVGNHLTKLVDAINEVKATIEAETYGMYPSAPLVTPKLVALIKV